MTIDGDLRLPADALIQEAYANEAAGDSSDGNHILFPTVEQQIRALVLQTPNRIYYGNDGQISAALLFKGRVDWEAYVANFVREGEEWKQQRSERFSAFDPKYIDRYLASWRVSFGTFGDLTNKPDEIYQVVPTNPTSVTEYIHVGKNKGQSKVAWHYAINPSIPAPHTRQITYTVGELSGVSAAELEPLATPPQILIDYSQRFS